MALAKKQSNSTRIVIIGVVVLVVAGIGYVLFQQFFIKKDTTAGDALNASRSKSVITNFGESILNDSRFTTLKPFDVTVNVNAETDGGQINPFR